MKTTRRGFIGLLAGAILGKVFGPKLIASPTEAAFAPVRLQGVRPWRRPIDSYLPLEVYSSEVLRIINEELIWLRLHQHYAERRDVWGNGRGADFHAVREPIREINLMALDGNFTDVCEPILGVEIAHQISVDLDLNEIDIDAPFGHISHRHLRPVALCLTRGIESYVRRNGGARHLVTTDLPEPAETERCISAANEDTGLCLRAIEHYSPIEGRWGRIDMRFGLGG